MGEEETEERRIMNAETPKENLKQAIPSMSGEDLSQIIAIALEAMQITQGFEPAADAVINWLGNGTTRDGCEILQRKLNAHVLDLRRCEMKNR